MKTNIIFAVLCLAVLGGIVLWRGGVAPTPAALESASTDLASAVDRAKRENKVVFAVATADWCAPCQTYKRHALASDEVGAWLDANAVTLTLDVTDQSNPNRDAIALGVGAIPASFIIDAEGNVLDTRTGAIPQDDLLAWLGDHTTN